MPKEIVLGSGLQREADTVLTLSSLATLHEGRFEFHGFFVLFSEKLIVSQGLFCLP